MTIRKKILMGNIMITLLTTMLVILICTKYVHLNNSTFPKDIPGSNEGVNALTRTMNILYTFEEEISGMNWEAVPVDGGQSAEVMLIPEKERVEELENLGFHIQAESPYGVSFTNLDAADLGMLASVNNGSSEMMYMSAQGIIIRDSFQAFGQIWYLTGVFNSGRGDMGVVGSLTPLYMVPKGFSFVFLMITVACVAVVSTIFSRLIAREVMNPLRELKKGAAMAAKGNLDYRISYAVNNEYGEVCKEFDRMRVQLKEAQERHDRDEEQQRERLRGITHDLRSPLTSIKGYAMGIKDGIANTPEKRNRYCDAILTRVDDMERLTGSLSLLVRMDKGSEFLRLDKVNLDEYIRQLLSEKEAWLADRKVDVRYRTQAPEAEVKLDIREMQRVFMNLFDNTVKYRTAERSRVEIAVRQNSDKVEIRFSDDGPGVGKQHLEHIFETLYRADKSRTAPEKGSGVGLAVVKRIIEGQGGQVEATSENGLCITMTLPSAKGESRNEENTDR